MGCALFLSLGAQNDDGDLLGNVRSIPEMDTKEKRGTVRQYKTSEHIEFHCDNADVVGLLSIRTGNTGLIMILLWLSMGTCFMQLAALSLTSYSHA